MSNIILKPYIDDTNYNLSTVIKNIELKNINLWDFKNHINKNEIKNRVLFLWWAQIIWSYSPFIHTYSSMLVNQNKFLYTLLDMTKEWLIIDNILNELDSNNDFLWANITMPYKIDVYKYFKEKNRLSASAILVWAVNTLSKINWNIYWYNTDFEWIINPIKTKLNVKEIEDIDTWYIIWTWWAAKAWIVAYLILWITDIVILGRKINIELLSHFNSQDIKNILKNKYWITKNINIKFKEYDIMDKDLISNIIDKKWILINTLPFWFKDNLPKKSILEWEVKKIKNNIKLFFDVVYDINYWDTPMIKEFKSFDIPVCDWIDMLVWQAVKWFELWTNWWKIDINKINKLLR